MNEIEEFLKRAAAMRARQQGAAQPPAQPSPPVRQPVQQRVATPLSARVGPADVLDAEVIEADAVTGDDVSDYVARHLDSSSFTQRASRLGAEVKAVDEVVETHLHETFEHRLGQLGTTTARAADSSLDEDENLAAAAATRPPAGVSIQDLIRSPQNLRNMIILSEILTPHSNRW